MTEMERTPRERLHHAIRNLFSDGIAAYYKKNPQFIGDDRSKKSMAELIDLVHKILQEIDKYDIRTKPDSAPKDCS